VGRRLSLGMLNVGYNQTSVCHQGPFPSVATQIPATSEVKVSFKQQDDGGKLSIHFIETFVISIERNLEIAHW
jgi:hypothetical protein